jgi:peptide deformylase
MSIRSLCFFPDPILRAEIQKVTQFDESLSQIVRDLIDTMKSQSHGIGIAAPQIGIALKVAIVDLSSRNRESKRYILVNPKIIAKSSEMLASREGCMSLPDYTADLKRRAWVQVAWQDEKGEAHEGRFSGIEGICFQHEIDHLNGKLFLDRVACLKTDMYARQIKVKSKFKK